MRKTFKFRLHEIFPQCPSKFQGLLYILNFIGYQDIKQPASHFLITVRNPYIPASGSITIPSFFMPSILMTTGEAKRT